MAAVEEVRLAKDEEAYQVRLTIDEEVRLAIEEEKRLLEPPRLKERLKKSL
jgi:hypothetical protein